MLGQPKPINWIAKLRENRSRYECITYKTDTRKNLTEEQKERIKRNLEFSLEMINGKLEKWEDEWKDHLRLERFLKLIGVYDYASTTTDDRTS